MVGSTTDRSAAGTDEGGLAARLDSLEGRTVAFVDLGKPNGREFFESLRAVLEGEFGVESVTYFEKTHYSSPMTESDLEAVLESGPDAAVEAISDCGSCNSSSVVDAVTLEERGVPTVQVITDEFVDLNRNISRSHGFDELPLVVVEHPTRYLDRDEVDELVERIKWSVQTVLTCEECLSDGCGVDRGDG